MVSRTNKFLKGVTIQTIFTVLLGGIEILVFSILSRLLSRIDFGYFATVSAIFTIFKSLSDAGLGSAIIHRKELTSKFISTALVLSLFISVLLYLILYTLSPILSNLIADNTICTPLRVMGCVIIFNSLCSIGNALLIKSLKFKVLGTIQLIAYILGGFVGILAAYYDRGFMSVIYLHLIQSLVHFVIVFIYNLKNIKFRIYFQYIKDIMSYGGWLTLSMILNNISQQIDKLLIPRLLSVEILGSYNRPAGFITTITTKFNGVFDTVLFPILSQIQDERQKIKEVTQRTVVLLNNLYSIICLVLFVNAHLIIIIFFGEEWIDLVPILKILSLNVLFLSNGRLADCYFRSLGLVKLGFQLRLVSLILSVLFVAVGSNWSIYGVSYSFLLSNMIIFLLKWFFLVKKINISFIEFIRDLIKGLRPFLILFILTASFGQYINHNICVEFLYFFYFSLVTIVLYIFFPKWVGEEYINNIYPIIKRFLHV